MATRSRQILVQMMVVLTVAVAAAILLFIWKIDEVAGILLGDPRPVILNGGILLLFALGTWRLVVGIRRYERQEILIADFLHRRAEGYPCSEILAEDDGTFRLDMSYFNYCQGLTMTGRKFERLFAGPRRRPAARRASSG